MSPSGDGWFGRPILRPAKEPPLPQIQHPAGHPLSVRVHSDFKKGSFETLLEIFMQVIEQKQPVLDHLKAIKDARELADIIGFTAASNQAGVVESLVELVKLLGRTTPEINSYDEEKNQYNITIKGDVHIVKGDAIHLNRSSRVKQAFGNVIAPLQTEGIEAMKILSDKREVTRITKAETGYFSCSDPEVAEELVAPSERTVAVQIVKPSFDPNLRWRVTEGEQSYGVIMNDCGFLEKVQARQITFTKGDTLLVKMESKQSQLHDGTLKTESTITKVLEQIRPGVERKLF